MLLKIFQILKSISVIFRISLRYKQKSYLVSQLCLGPKHSEADLLEAAAMEQQGFSTTLLMTVTRHMMKTSMSTLLVLQNL
jgi:hypothetical protein